MKDSWKNHEKSMGLKSNGGMHRDMDTDLGRRSTDIGNTVIPLQLSRLVKTASALVVGSFVIGGLYMSFDTRLTRLECGQTMLIDVVVYKKLPEQPNCQ